jgi:ribulose kinase
MDHRATLEAEHINRVDREHFSGRVLSTVGGVISPEMQMPKLLWLKRNLPQDKWAAMQHALDLSDFLTWKATGEASRSLCAAVCKWNYAVQEVNGEDGWHKEYLEAIGMDELTHEEFGKLGKVKM